MTIYRARRLPCHCASLRQATRIVTQVYDEALRPAGITSSQFNLLEAIGAAPGLRTGDLARILAVDSTTLTRSLALLQKAKLIRLASSPDLRERRWALSRSGRNTLAAARPCWQRAQERLEGVLGVDLAARLQEICFDLVGGLSS